MHVFIARFPLYLVLKPESHSKNDNKKIQVMTYVPNYYSAKPVFSVKCNS